MERLRLFLYRDERLMKVDTKNIDQAIKALRKQIKGEVLYDDISLELYSTDASIFRIRPYIVVVPRDVDDVIRTVNVAQQFNIPIIPRGAGSGVAGQAIGKGIILDFSKYMTKILEINLDEKYAIVEPGVVHRELQKALEGTGYVFPPNPSSNAYCTIGGMVGTNAAGSRYTRDYVDELWVVLPNGELIHTRPIKLDGEEWTEITSKDTQEARLYKLVRDILENKQELFEKYFPKVRYNSSGYAGLKDCIKDGWINLSKLFIGSEGTLGIVVKAKARLEKKAKYDVTVVSFYDDLDKAARAVGELLKFKPENIELMDKGLIDLAKNYYPQIAEKIPSGTEVVLLTEQTGDDLQELEKIVNEAKKRIHDELKLAFEAAVATTPETKEALWEARRIAVPLLLKLRERRKIVAAIEDAAVDPVNGLPEYVRAIKEISKKYDIPIAVYGHAGKGLLHLRPFVDMKSEADIKALIGIQDDAFKVVKKLGGVFAAEHGDGRVRSRFVKETYGPIYELFVEIKELVDPLNLMNPGIKVNADGTIAMDQLRYGPQYQIKNTISPILAWSPEEFILEVETCHGCSRCTTPTFDSFISMCPSYKADRDERASPKAKNNLWRSWLSGELPADAIYSKEFKEVWDYCFGCTNCFVECPSNVNTAAVVIEGKAQWLSKNRIRLQDFVLSNFDKLGSLSCKFSPLSNWMMKIPPNRFLMEKTIGIHRKRKLPEFQRTTFRKWYKKNHKNGASKTKTEKEKPIKKVAYFHGCFANYNKPDIGKAFVELFTKLGIEVVVPPQACCGTPKLAYGRVDATRKVAKKNIDAFLPLIKEGYDVLVTCSSCGLMLRQEYPHLVLKTPEAKEFADHVYHFSEYLLKLEEEGIITKLQFKEIEKELGIGGYHTPCHLKTQPTAKTASITLLSRIPNNPVKDITQACCGIAGSWGYKKQKFDKSLKIGSALGKELNNEQIQYGVTDCPTCNTQMRQLADKPIYHPVEILNKALVQPSK